MIQYMAETLYGCEEYAMIKNRPVGMKAEIYGLIRSEEMFEAGCFMSHNRLHQFSHSLTERKMYCNCYMTMCTFCSCLNQYLAGISGYRYC